jgi:hypothetical protein
MRGRRNEIPVRGEAIARHVAVQIAPEHSVLVQRQLADGSPQLFEIETGVCAAHRIEGPDGRAMTRAQCFVTLEQLEMPTEVTRAPLLFADAEHVGDERAGAAPSGDGESEPAISVESQLFAVGDEDRATRIREYGQDIDRDQLLRRHAPDTRLEANQKSQRVERLPGAVDLKKVVGGALGMLPAEGRKDDVAEPGNALPPAIPVTS